VAAYAWSAELPCPNFSDTGGKAFKVNERSHSMYRVSINKRISVNVYRTFSLVVYAHISDGLDICCSVRKNLKRNHLLVHCNLRLCIQ
jgi:hypothetical protein